MVFLGWLLGIVITIVVIAIVVVFLNRFYRKSTRDVALVRANDTIYHEDLQTAHMVKNHHLAKSISDAFWSPKAYPSAGMPARTVARAYIGTITLPGT